MFRIHLTNEMASNDSSHYALLHDLRKINIPRPYETTVIPRWAPKDTRFVFSTTSKDVHLKIGRIGFGAQTLLCKLLEDSYEEGKDAQMSFSIETPEGEPSSKTLFVARTVGEDLHSHYIMFHLAAGH